MISFMDMAFCASEVKEHTCGREFTAELAKRAEKWWGSKDYPVAYGKFCEASDSPSESTDKRKDDPANSKPRAVIDTIKKGQK